ncbi:hypothetical protein PVT67_11935 [Gallaecimonas kandeliae]|uniref:ApeA N-terminal domain 1-containing protein n=1 Tax=Gallaecimonas kandeliae TaxID=3029055 RepID=UPI002648998F|nr:hypothetical protein [Gallaecimonas kandeliae]WKE64384.1 hypothetical protein PVT67_11935 [Gallaecimonas kandeliae]
MEDKLFCVLDDFEFFGEFFQSEDSYATRFPGRVTYSPEDGLILHYNIADNDIKFEYKYLIGVLDNGKRCTLIGPFDFRNSGLRFGQLTTRYGKHKIRYLVVGEFLDGDTKYNYCSFATNHMQAFFNDVDNLEVVPYQDESLMRICGDKWNLSLENRASFSDVTNRLKNLVRIEDDNARMILSDALEKIDGLDLSERMYLRKELEVVFVYEKENQSIESLFNIMRIISSMFSMLVGAPNFPEKILLGRQDGDGKISVISNVDLESGTIALAKRKINHHQMPINCKGIDLDKVVKKWISLHDEYQVIATVFSYEKNYRTLHEAHCDIVLYATNLEAISYRDKEKLKYEYPVCKYSSPSLLDFIKRSLSKAECASIGEAIGSLRNEIAHVGKPKKIMSKLNIRDYVNIGFGMKLVIVSYLFGELGIEMEVIHRYQERSLP